MILEHLKEQAIRAYNNISFSPEQRGESIVREYSAELTGDISNMPESDKVAYISRYEALLLNWLSAKSRTISTMITGPANFPVRRAEKANQSEQNRYSEFRDWRDKALKGIAKRKEDSKPQDQKDSEVFEYTKNQILSSCQTIIGIDNGTERGYSRALFVSNLTGRINRIAKTGNIELLAKCLDLIKEVNESVKKPVISNSNSIWKLLEVAEATREAKFDRENKPNREFKIESGIVLLNYEADRLQLIFDSKPEYSIISKLKQNAFRWSPTNSAWQRQLTNNAIYAAVNVVGEFRQPAINHTVTTQTNII